MFIPVNWPPDSEVTSARLDQMAQNEQYLKDNLVIATKEIGLGGHGEVGPGRTVGRTQALKIFAHYEPFSSGIPLLYYDITYSFPAGTFTQIPVQTISLFSIHGDAYSHIFIQNQSANGPFSVRIFRVDQIYWVFDGSIDVIAVGI